MNITPQQPSQQKIIDHLALECSLFSLSKKCFIMCQNKLKKSYNVENIFDINSDQIIDKFDQCIDACAFEYAAYRTQVRKQFVDDMSKVNQKNDDVYNSFYK